MTLVESLWGEEFNIDDSLKQTKKVLERINNPKEPITKRTISSKKLSLQDKLNIIKEEVERVLGKYKDETLIIKDKQTFINYIDTAIKNNLIAIDTETNNSLDPITCKLMGACIYTPGLRQAYIPVNHVNPNTDERLEWQLTEKDIKEQFSRLNVNNTRVLTHNGKFDYEVLHCTCDWDMDIYWDSYVAARMLDENEPSAGLKQQYIDKIDSNQEKYSIDELFESVQYAQVDPDIFALYAATDAYMTYKLYKWQEEAFEDPSLSRIYYLYKNVEIPVTTILAKMELTGTYLDKDYCKRLTDKYHNLLEECDVKLNQELESLQSTIDRWKLTSEANYKTVDKKGKIASKSKLEQLSDPISLNSPTQLAILIYDILKCPVVNEKSPRGTGVEELTLLYEKTNINLFKIMLEKRTLDKLVNTFIDKMPTMVNPKDNRVHAQFFNVATDTHRFSSKNPNMQNLPRDYKDIRPMFSGTPEYDEIKKVENQIVLNPWDEVESNNTFIRVDNLKIGDCIDNHKIVDIKYINYKYTIVFDS